MTDAFDAECAYMVEQAVQILYDKNISVTLQSQSGGRPMRSTSSAPKIAESQVKICRMSLMSVLWKEFFMLMLSRMMER
jgi:type III secretory pathway lipoprotein EscJ